MTLTPARRWTRCLGVTWHLSDAWARESQLNVLLVHYDDLLRDLDGEMRRLARRLGVTVLQQAWPSLVQAATFEQMRARADQFVTAGAPLKSSAAFFRRADLAPGKRF